MTTTIQKWGNSQGIRIPRILLEEVKWSENEPIEIKVEDNKIVIEKAQKTERKNIKELFKDYKGEYEPSEIDEQAGYRSAVVISNNIFNQKTGLTVVCPITNTDNHFPLHIPLDSRTKTTGVILCEHVRTLDLKSRGYQLIEKIPNDLLKKTIDIIFAEIEQDEN